MRLEYCGECRPDLETVLPQWYRDFEVADKISLEQLASLIIEIIGWEEDHLYEFKIKNKNYVNLTFGYNDDYFVDSWKPCVSCAIPLYLIGFVRREVFAFIFDFGDEHTFRITIISIYPSINSILPRVISYRGCNLLQYPKALSREQARLLRRKPPVVSPPPRQRDRWRIRYVRAEDKQTLVEWRESNDRRLWQKAVTVLENRNLQPEEIAKKVEMPLPQIEKWIRSFNRFGIEGLNPPRKKRTPGKKEAATELRRKRILEILHDRPASFGINRASWNLSSLAAAHKKRHGEVISRSSIGRIVQKSGYTIKKARRVLTSPDPNYREKVELVLSTLRNLQPNELFFFIDELGPLRVKKYGGRAFVRKREALTVPQEQVHKGSITMAGALSATTNQVSWLYCATKDTYAMIDLVEILFNQHITAKRIYLTWDAASWHKSGFLVEWLDKFNAETMIFGYGPTIHLVPLPTSSQFLDVIESVFSGMKRAVIHHSDYQSTMEMKVAISRHFVERNLYFQDNPKRAGKKIWEVDFFQDLENLSSGNYREW